MAPRGAPPRAGFTLIELLIVITIMILLISMLTVACARALNEADMIQCRANLRNIGVAALIFAQNNDGDLPVSLVLEGPHPALVAALKEYIGDPRTYFCPSEDTDPDRVYSAENVEAGRVGYFYFSCKQATENKDISAFLRRDVRWPRRLHFADDSGKWLASDSWFRGKRTAHRQFKKGVNYVRIGGDVQTVMESPRQAFE